MKHRNHEESDLQCNLSHFRKYMQKFYHKIFFIILILRTLDLFCFRHRVLVAVAHHARQNRRKFKFPSISREYFSRAIKVILTKIVFDFTVGGVLENVKLLPQWSMTFVCNKGAQRGGLQKRNIQHICLYL